MKMSLALLAIVISLFSLALQLRGQKPIPPLEKFIHVRISIRAVQTTHASISTALH